jgi:hypothetical protein
MREILVEADEMQQSKQKEQNENQVKNRDDVFVDAGSAHDDRADSPNDKGEDDGNDQPDERGKESFDRAERHGAPVPGYL